MKKQLQVWQLISKSLEQNIAVMLLYVLESDGSSPGRQGFFMAVNANEEMIGSIGGGIMEHKFVKKAKDKLKHNEYENNIYIQIHNKSSLQFQSGMLCSGEQSIFVYRVKASDSYAIKQIINCIENNKSGTLTLSSKGISFDEEIPEDDTRFFRDDERKEDWIYKEQIGYKNHMYIIGAGHCALALSKILSMIGFYIHLYDDRENLNTFLENEYVHQKTIINNYTEINNLTITGDNNFVIVMTMGYRTDDIVVRSLLNKEFKYFGLLGSKKKIEKMFSDYLKEGIDESLIKRIYAPAGLPIHSQTPEEIAISIAAQIIGLKNEL